MNETLKNILEWANLAFVFIFFIALMKFLLMDKVNDAREEKRQRIRGIKQRRKIAKEIGNHCYWCDAEMKFDQEALEDIIKEAKIAMCYSCAGRLERYRRCE